MRIYENLFIVKPDATEEEIDHLVDLMSKHVTTAGGTIDKVDKWGKRRLAYRIEKHREGSYILMQFTAEPSTVKEFERRLRVQDSVMKFITVRIDETLKRLKKTAEVKVYKGAGHGFFCDDRASYDAGSAQSAWEMVRSWLAKYLKSSS